MSEKLPVPSSNGWLADWLENGKLPGAAKAIAQLVGSVANAGSAWINIATVKGQQIQQGIKDDTNAGSVVSKALAKAAAKQGAEDTALVERAVEQWAGARLKAQKNRESIAKLAVEALSEGDPLQPETAPPDEEWIDIFGEYAEKATSERMQRTWSKVLEGEIRKPGAFSYRTLSLISVLDAKAAQDFQYFTKFITDGYIIEPTRFDWTSDFVRMSGLKEIGLFSDTVARRFTFTAAGNVLINAKNYALILSGDPGVVLSIDAIPLTVSGSEIFGVIEFPNNFDTLVDTSTRLLEKPEIKDIKICTFDRQDGSTLRWNILKTVER